MGSFPETYDDPKRDLLAGKFSKSILSVDIVLMCLHEQIL